MVLRSLSAPKATKSIRWSSGLRGVWQVGAAPFHVFARTKHPCSEIKTSRFPFGEVTSEPSGPTETQSFAVSCMTLCAPVILTNSAVGVQEQDYIGTSWRSNNPIRVTCSRKGPAMSARPLQAVNTQQWSSHAAPGSLASPDSGSALHQDDLEALPARRTSETPVLMLVHPSAILRRDVVP